MNTFPTVMKDLKLDIKTKELIAKAKGVEPSVIRGTVHWSGVLFMTYGFHRFDNFTKDTFTFRLEFSKEGELVDSYVSSTMEADKINNYTERARWMPPQDWKSRPEMANRELLKLAMIFISEERGLQTYPEFILTQKGTDKLLIVGFEYLPTSDNYLKYEVTTNIYGEGFAGEFSEHAKITPVAGEHELTPLYAELAKDLENRNWKHVKLVRSPWTPAAGPMVDLQDRNWQYYRRGLITQDEFLRELNELEEENATP